MELLPILRFALFGLVLLFSVVELGLCAKDILVTKRGVFIDDGFEILQLSPFFFPFAAFGLAISVLTLLFITPVLIIDIVRKGALTSVIAFELIWTGIFWVLWLAVAGNATAAGIFDSCSFEDNRVDIICHQFSALQGLAFFNWLLLFGWWVTLCVLAVKLRRKSSDASLWRQSVVSTHLPTSDPQPSSSRGFKFWQPKSQGSGSVRMQNIASSGEVQEVKLAPVYDQYTSQNNTSKEGPRGESPV